MPYVIVENFKGGLDVRRSVLASAPGTLSKAQNVHVSRGGEIEKRKAFVAVDTGVETDHTNPFAGTFGMESTSDGVTVFSTSYTTITGYNQDRIVHFLYAWQGDESDFPSPSPDKAYVRFQYQNQIHEIDLPQLSVSANKLVIPAGSKTIDVSLTPPGPNNTLVNYVETALGNDPDTLVLIGSTPVSGYVTAMAFPIGISRMPKGGILFLNFTPDRIFGKIGNAKFEADPITTQSAFLKKTPYCPWGSGYASPPPYLDVYIDTDYSPPGGTGPIPIIRGSWAYEQRLSISIAIPSAARASGNNTRMLGVPFAPDNRKSIKWRIETIYTNIKVVEVDHPDGQALVGIVYSTVYGGKSFVLAKFANGDVLPFFDGKLVSAFTDGVYNPSQHVNLYGFVNSVANLMKEGIDFAKNNFANNGGVDDPIRNYSVSTVQTNDGASMTITGPINVDFKVNAFMDDPCEFTIETLQEPVEPVPAKKATATFTLAGGSNGSASTGLTLRYIMYYGFIVPPISGIFITTDYDDPSIDTAGAIEITGLDRNGTLKIEAPYDGIVSDSAWHPNQKLAYQISYYINSAAVNTGISSSYAEYGRGWNQFDPASFTIASTPKLGGAINNRGVWIEFTSSLNLTPPIGGATQIDELIDPATVRVSPFNSSRFVARLGYSYRDYPSTTTYGKMKNGARNSVDSVIANSVELLSDIDPRTMNSTLADKSQHFESSIEQLAEDVTNSINHRSSTHNYKASRDSATVTVTSALDGTAGNLKSIRATTSGSVTLAKQTNFTSGRNLSAGQSKVVKINFKGTPDTGDRLWVSITDPSRPDIPYRFGATRMAGKKGAFCITYKGKQYIGVDSTLYFSALNNATKWDIYDTGSGFIDMSNNFGGREPLTGIGVYQNNLAVFTERHCQLWFFDPDPTLSSQRQVLDNTGCIAPNSVVSVGAVDLFYLSYNGIRSLQSRESTDAAYANDIGSAIDDIIIQILSSLTEEQRASAKAIIEPTDGRYWIAIGSKLFVLSYFKGSGVLAWSEYVPGFQIDEMVVFKGRVYVRSGNKIYLYGGQSGNQYDNSQIILELPYLDANRPAGYKQVNGIDATCEGEWVVQLGFDYTNPTQRDTIAIISQPTFALGRVMAAGVGTHIGPRLISSFNGYCRLANLIVHYSDMHSKHEG